MTKDEVLAKVYEVIDRVMKEHEDDLRKFRSEYVSEWEETYCYVENQKYALECLKEQLERAFSDETTKNPRR